MRALMLVPAAFLAGCTAEVIPGQPTMMCEALDGSDRFVIDPDHEDTRAVRTFSGVTMSFRDQISGFHRAMKDEDFIRYRCIEIDAGGAA